MTNIRKVRAFYREAEGWYKSWYFETGLRADGSYYFRNQLIEIPNEFETCPDYYPRMFFSKITSFLDKAELWDSDTQSDAPWHFYVELSNGEEQTLSSSDSCREIHHFLYYSNLLDFTVGNWTNKKIRLANSFTFTLDDLRGEVKLGSISLSRFINHRIELLFRGRPDSSYEDCVLEKPDGRVEILLQENPYAEVEPASIIIGNDGSIEDNGDVLYAYILQENKVKVLKDYSNRYKSAFFVNPDETTRRKFLDPNYLLNESTTEYSFANKEEYNIFCRRYQSSGKVIWNTSAEYVVNYNEAFEEYEKGNYENALRMYFNTLRINPIAIDARFEIANCYIKLGDFTKAKITLAILKDFLFTDQNIAKFYRTLGYILSEEENDYLAAYCCYKHSSTYDRAGLYKSEVDHELIYLSSVEDYYRSRAKYWASHDPVQELGWCNIPILKANEEIIKD